jgi:quinol-cytochrome oxidoreductase complex cytochrome b subunit
VTDRPVEPEPSSAGVAKTSVGQAQRRREPLTTAEGLAAIVRALAWLLAIAGAGLVATGLPLIWVYEPDPPGGSRGDFWWLREAHGVASTMLLGAVAGIVVVLAVAGVRRLRVPPGWLVAFGAFVVAGLGQISGQLIAWDQLALKAVTVGDDVRGVVDGLGNDVRFLLIDGTEVSQGTYAAWAVVHVLAVPVIALGVVWFARRRAAVEPPPEPGQRLGDGH